MGAEGSGRSGFTEEIAFPEARVKEQLGRYELLAPLGKGGMATVFLARLRGPSGFEKLLALKRIHPALSEDPRFIAMFLDEARVAAALQHPNIAQVFELGHEGSTYFLAMEYLHGEHLGDVLTRAARVDAPLPIELTCWIIARIAEALHHAHEATDALGRPLSIIHRDVSPQNIFVTYAGDAKLTDFGVAKASSNVVETDTGTVKGKFAYMAPEQALGGEIDRRVDVFALGTVLWEALAGRRLFRANTDAQTLLRVTRCEVPSLIGIRPDVGEDLDAIVQCALTADPSGRFETAGALARALGGRSGDASAEDVRAFMRAHFREAEQRKRALVAGSEDGVVPTTVEEASTSGVVNRGERPADTSASPDLPTRAAPRREPIAEATTEDARALAPAEAPRGAAIPTARSSDRATRREPAIEPAARASDLAADGRARAVTRPDVHGEPTHALASAPAELSTPDAHGEHALASAPVREARSSAWPRVGAALAVIALAVGAGAAWLAFARGTTPPSAPRVAPEVASERSPAPRDTIEPGLDPPDRVPEAPVDEPAIHEAPTAAAPTAAAPTTAAPTTEAPTAAAPTAEAPTAAAALEEPAGSEASAVARPPTTAPRIAAAPPGTLQISVAPSYPGARWGWARVGSERHDLPAVFRDVPSGVVWIHYQLGDETMERRARVRVEPGRTAVVQLPR